MTAIELYKFIHNNNTEYHWYSTEAERDVIMFVPIRLIARFHKLIGSSILDEDGIECVMKDGYFCFKMDEILEHHDIELDEVFEKEKSY